MKNAIDSYRPQELNLGRSNDSWRKHLKALLIGLLLSFGSFWETLGLLKFEGWRCGAFRLKTWGDTVRC